MSEPNLPPSWKSEIEEAIEKSTDASSKRHKAENEKNAADVASAIKSFVDAYNTQNNKPERKDKIKRLLDVATVVLLFGTALFTGLGWWVFHSQLNEMKIEQRAWIVPRVVDFIQIEKGKPIKVGISYENVGKEPALSITETNEIIVDEVPKVNTFILDTREKWPKCKAQPVNPGSNVAYPGSALGQYRFNITSPIIVDDAFMSGDKAFAIYGCFAYETVGTIRHSSFCRSYKAKNPDAMIGCFTAEYAD